MSEDFADAVLRHVVTLMAYNIGWDASQTTALDILADVMKRHFLNLAKSCHTIGEGCGRSQVNLDDVSLALKENNVTIAELEEYVQNFDPVSLAYAAKVPAFPVKRESKLNFLKPGSEEVLSRPVHVHEYMPPMIFEPKHPSTDEHDAKIQRERRSDEEASTSAAAAIAESNPDDPIPAAATQIAAPVPEQIVKKESQEEEVVNVNVNLPSPSKGQGHDLQNGSRVREEGDSSEDEIEALGATSPGGTTKNFVPFSGHGSKSQKSKRNAHLGENPALKRVRMMLEEDGHPLRELSSAMMTTSGFLTSSREGRLPDSRPPPNKEFFDPVPIPVTQDRKKKGPPLTMKRIVEGIKKIDSSEPTPSLDEEEEPIPLFANPDKIKISPPKPKKLLETPPPPIILKTGKSSKKLKKKLKIDKEMIKKLAAGLEARDREKNKLYKKSSRALLDKSKKLKDKKFIAAAQLAAAQAEAVAAAAAQIRREEEGEFEEINSDEEVGVVQQPVGVVPGLVRIPKKHRGVPLGLVDAAKFKKFKNKSLSLTPASVGGGHNLISPPKFGGLLPQMGGGGYYPKKRGRPRKVSALPPSPQQMGIFPGGGVPLSAQALANLGRGLMEDRPLKIKKSHMEPDMRSLIPEVHLDLNVPPHPGGRSSARGRRSGPPQQQQLPPRMTQQPPVGGAMADLFLGLPSTPGLIPSNFVLPPPPPLKKMPVPHHSPTAKDKKIPFSNICSSLTITPIDMGGGARGQSQGHGQGQGHPGQGHGQGQVHPPQGLGLPPILKSKPNRTSPSGLPQSLPSNLPGLKKLKREPSPHPQPHPQAQEHSSSSGITITPILMEKYVGQHPSEFEEDPSLDYAGEGQDLDEYDDMTPEGQRGDRERPISMLAKLDEDMKSKEARRKDKERRKEMKKEKKDKKKDKGKDKDKKKDKKNKKISAEPGLSSPKEGGGLLSVPKLTLKLSTSGTPTPVDSPNPPPVYVGEVAEPVPPPPLKKITIKSAPAVRPPSPELAKFSPLVTRTPPKPPARAAKVQAAAAVAAEALGTSFSQQMASFSTPRGSGGSSKRGSNAAASSSGGRGRNASAGKGGDKGKASGGGVGGLITETVGCIVDEQGNKIWICPSCKRQDDGSPMIGCDRCDDWYHFICVGITVTPEEDTEWFCPRCRIKKKKVK